MMTGYSICAMRMHVKRKAALHRNVPGAVKGRVGDRKSKAIPPARPRGFQRRERFTPASLLWVRAASSSVSAGSPALDFVTRAMNCTGLNAGLK